MALPGKPNGISGADVEKYGSSYNRGSFEHVGIYYTAGVGRFENGDLAEIFLNTSKNGTAVDVNARASTAFAPRLAADDGRRHRRQERAPRQARERQRREQEANLAMPMRAGSQRALAEAADGIHPARRSDAVGLRRRRLSLAENRAAGKGCAPDMRRMVTVMDWQGAALEAVFAAGSALFSLPGVFLQPPTLPGVFLQPPSAGHTFPLQNHQPLSLGVPVSVRDHKVHCGECQSLSRGSYFRSIGQT